MNEEQKREIIQRFIVTHKAFCDANYEHEQRNMNKEILIQRYDTELGNILRDYTFMMTEINEGLNAARNDIEASIRELYETKFKNMFLKMKIIKVENSGDLDSYMKKFDEEIFLMLSDIQIIQNMVKVRINNLDKTFSKSFIDELLKQEDDDYQEKIRKQDQDFGNQVLQLGEDSRRKEREMNDFYKEQMQKLREEYATNNYDVFTKNREQCIAFYDQFYQYRDSCDEMRETVKQLQKANDDYINKLKEKFLEQMKEIQKTDELKMEKMNKFQQMIEDYKKQLENELKEMKLKLENKKMILEEEFNMLKNRYQQKLDENQRKFLENSPKIANEDEINKLLKNYDEELNIELNQLKSENMKEENELTQKYLDKQQIFSQLTEKYQVEEENMKKELEKLIQQNKINENDEAGSKRISFLEEKKKYRDAYNQYKSQLQELIDLLKEKELILQKQKNPTENNDFDMNDLLNKLRENNINEETKLNKEYDEKKKKYEQEEQEKLNYLQEIDNKERIKFHEENEKQLNLIRQQFEENIRNEENNFKKEFQELKEQLNSIQIRRVISTPPDEDIKEFEKLLQNTKSANEKEKEVVIEEWKKKEEQENMNHSLKLEEYKNHITFQETFLNRLKINNALKIEEYEKAIHDKQIYLKILSNQVIKATVTLDIPSKDELLSKTNKESQDAINSAIQQKFDMIRALQDKIEELRKENQQTKEDLLIIQTKALNNFMITIKEMQNAHKETTQNYQKQIDYLKEERSSFGRSKLEVIKGEIKRMTEKLSKFKEYSAEKLRLQRESLNNRLNENDKRYKDEIQIFRTQNQTQKQLISCSYDIANQKMINAKKKYESRESRKEDLSTIDRLQDQFNQKNQQLLMITKDLNEYKNRMKIQEAEVNARFGVLPAVTTVTTVTKTDRNGILSARRSHGTLPKLLH